MSQKRKHGETLDSSSSTPKPFKKHRAFTPGQSHQKPKKRPHVSNDIDSTTSNNALKSRIRDLKRLLVHVENVGNHKMSAGKRVERERELEACEHELKEKIESSREAEYRKKMIGKYHQVRFFDRQKGTRILKRLKKELSNEEDESKKEKLKQRVHNAEVDVNYTQYYPLMKVYSSLYPKSKKEKSADSDEAMDEGTESKANKEIDGPKGDMGMWKTVEEAMAKGTLDALRNRKEDMPAAAPKKEKKQKPQQQAVNKKEIILQKKLAEATNRRERRALGIQAEEEADDSDGGFFE